MDISVTDWDGFFQNNDVLVPYLDACVFATKRLRRDAVGSIYEFGCGMGNNLRFLHSLFPTARYLGSDISSVAISKLRATGFARSHFWVNDERLRIPEPINIVIERGALQHVSREQARTYVSEIFEAMRPGAEGFFEIASTEHALFKSVGEGGRDAGHGLRYFYTLNDIEELFSRFEITRVYHLKREIVAAVDDNLGDAQGSYQVEVRKG